MAVILTYNSDHIPQDTIREIFRRFLVIHERGNVLIIDGDDINEVRNFVGDDWVLEIDYNI